MHMVKIIGMRHSLNRAPRMKPKEQATSANITSQNERVLPIPNGSGNISIASLNAIHLAMPWLINNAPNTTRAARNFLILSLYIVCGIFRENTAYYTFVLAGYFNSNLTFTLKR